MNNVDKYFEVLGLKVGASLQKVEQPGLDLIKVWHPDRFAQDPELQAKAQEKTKDINEGYERILVFLEIIASISINTHQIIKNHTLKWITIIRRIRKINLQTIYIVIQQIATLKIKEVDLKLK